MIDGQDKKMICPGCSEVSEFMFDDFEIGMQRYAHKDKAACWVRMANREPKLFDTDNKGRRKDAN